MRNILLGAALGAVMLPAFAAEAHPYRHHGRDWREVRQEQRECRRELRRADSRREYRRELRECRREIARARYGYGRYDRYEYRPRRLGYYGYHAYAPPPVRYWDGWRWRYRY